MTSNKLAIICILGIVGVVSYFDPGAAKDIGLTCSGGVIGFLAKSGKTPKEKLKQDTDNV